MSAGVVSQDSPPLMAAVCQEAACTVSSGATVRIAAIRQFTARAHLAPPATAPGDTSSSNVTHQDLTILSTPDANQDVKSSNCCT